MMVEVRLGCAVKWVKGQNTVILERNALPETSNTSRRKYIVIEWKFTVIFIETHKNFTCLTPCPPSVPICFKEFQPLSFIKTSPVLQKQKDFAITLPLETPFN